MKYYKIIEISLFLLSLLENVFSKPNEDLRMLLNTHSHADTTLQQSKQFIGTSVIGGLMWPVLLTLTFTAIMARVPDAFQRLLTRPGSSRYMNNQRKGSPISEEYLNKIMQSLLTSIDAREGYN